MQCLPNVTHFAERCSRGQLQVCYTGQPVFGCSSPGSEPSPLLLWGDEPPQTALMFVGVNICASDGTVSSSSTYSVMLSLWLTSLPVRMRSNMEIFLVRFPRTLCVTWLAQQFKHRYKIDLSGLLAFEVLEWLHLYSHRANPWFGEGSLSYLFRSSIQQRIKRFLIVTSSLTSEDLYSVSQKETCSLW